MIHIIGAGALGLLWAARLARADLPCSLILSSRQRLHEWASLGNRLRLTHKGAVSTYRVGTQLGNDSSDPIQILIVATKAFSVNDALQAVSHRLTADTCILLLQNGMGSQQAVAQAFPEQRVLFGSVTDGAWISEPGHVVWAGEGSTQIGDPVGGPPPACLGMFTHAGIGWHWHPEIMDVLWRKLAINCAINPFTALYDCRNGEVPHYAGERLKSIVKELESVLGAHGVGVEPQELAQLVFGVIERTKDNSSSMRQDIKARRRTEIAYILGFACQAAQSSGLRVPALDDLLEETRQHLLRLGLPVA